MIDSIAGAASFVAGLQQQKTAEEISTAVLVKTQDAQKQQGADAIALINSAKIGPDGVDVHV